MTTEKKHDVIGTARVVHTGRSLYFCDGGGEFTSGDIKGTYSVTVGSRAIIVYIGGESYECRADDVIEAALEHYRFKLKDAPDEEG